MSLEGKEDRIHQALDHDCSDLLRDKQFLLFKVMAADAGVDDEHLVDTLVNGVNTSNS